MTMGNADVPYWKEIVFPSTVFTCNGGTVSPGCRSASARRLASICRSSRIFLARNTLRVTETTSRKTGIYLTARCPDDFSGMGGSNYRTQTIHQLGATQ